MLRAYHDDTYLQLVLTGLSLRGGVGEIDGENLVRNTPSAFKFMIYSYARQQCRPGCLLLCCNAIATQSCRSMGASCLVSIRRTMIAVFS
jgi:hypothetical protein